MARMSHGRNDFTMSLRFANLNHAKNICPLRIYCSGLTLKETVRKEPEHDFNQSISQSKTPSLQLGDVMA